MSKHQPKNWNIFRLSCLVLIGLLGFTPAPDQVVANPLSWPAVLPVTSNGWAAQGVLQTYRQPLTMLIHKKILNWAYRSPC